MASGPADDIRASTRKLGVVRFAVTGALASSIFFILCWIGAQIPNFGPATHMYLSLFTNAELNSGAALVQGVVWSIGFGLIAGTLIAALYNALAFLDRR